jgi:trimethylamine:corrinoid methyltransferase-like protein
MALRLVRGVETREVDLLALFGALAATGELLSHPHTRKNHRLELFSPSALVERGSWSAWRQGGGKRAEERAAMEVERRLAGPATVTLDADRTRKVDEIMQADLAKHGAPRLPVA